TASRFKSPRCARIAAGAIRPTPKEPPDRLSRATIEGRPSQRRAAPPFLWARALQHVEHYLIELEQGGHAAPDPDLGAVLPAVIAAAAFWFITMPETVSADALGLYSPDLDNGKTMFHAGGCAACHSTPNQEDKTKLGGGLGLKSPFGTFFAPNISPDRDDGIGGWSEANFVTAMWKGTSPDGSHSYPVFPYPSYQRMRLEDVRDLFAYLKTLPAVQGKARGHDLPLHFQIRRMLGGWKF